MADSWHNGIAEAVARMREHVDAKAPIRFDARDRAALNYILNTLEAPEARAPAHDSAEAATPPPGRGWIPLVIDGKVDPTIAWAEVRPFGGALYGRMRFETKEPALFVRHVEEPRR